MGSPLGKYSQVVAAIVALSIIGTYLLSLVFGHALVIDSDTLSALKDLALIATGAVFGSVATVNGLKAPIEAAHKRVDHLEAGTGIPTHGAYTPPPPVDPAV